MTTSPTKWPGTILLLVGVVAALAAAAANLLFATEVWLTQRVRSAEMSSPVNFALICILVTTSSILMIYGGLQFRRAQRRGMALIGAVCCVLESSAIAFLAKTPEARIWGYPTLLIGLWLCWVLFKPDIKVQFAKGPAG